MRISYSCLKANPRGGLKERHTLNSCAIGESTSQYLARMTLACAVVDWGRSSSCPAAWVRHCVAMKMDSWRSWGSDEKDAW